MNSKVFRPECMVTIIPPSIEEQRISSLFRFGEALVTILLWAILIATITYLRMVSR